MSLNPHNVDICVTCICDKPPKLPLREELPSLGIEVVYNAGGIGAEATEKEMRKERKMIHKLKMKDARKHNKKKDRDKFTGRRLNPPGISPMSSTMGKVFNLKQDPPEDLGIPKALSYGSYQQTFDLRTKEEAKSVTSSIETSSSMGEKCSRDMRKKKLTKRLKGLFAKKRNPNEPPNSVEFLNTEQTLEEVALQEAFEAFMSDEDDDVPVKPSRSELLVKKSGEMAGMFPNLWLDSNENPEQMKKGNDAKLAKEHTKVCNSSSSEIDQTSISSLGTDSSIYKKCIVISDDKVFSKQAREAFRKQVDESLNQLKMVEYSDSTTKTNKSIADKGNIRVKLFSNGVDNQISEIYDLTEISVSDSGKINPRKDIATDMLFTKRQNFPEFLADDDHDDFTCCRSKASILMDRHSQSDDGEDSSVPVPRMHDQFGKCVLDVRNVYEKNGPGSSLVLSSMPPRGSHNFGFSPASLVIPKFGKKKQNLHHNSLISNPMKELEFVQDKRDDVVVCRCDNDDMSSTFRERNLSPIKLHIASPYRTCSLGRNIQSINDATDKFISMRMTPTISSSGSKQLPTFRRKVSRDSYDTMKSSKLSSSEDLTEHLIYDYTKSMDDVEFSLPDSSTVNEGKDLNDLIPSALSQESNEAFQQGFGDQYDVGENSITQQQNLLKKPSFGDRLIYKFEETIKLSPSIASQRFPSTDMHPLHSACLQPLPTRFAKSQPCRVADLVDDLRLHRKLIEDIIIAAGPGICRTVDVNGDLPVHIMARELMEWEGQWYQNVYDKADLENDKIGGSEISILYQAMSEIVNKLLEPIIYDDSLCQQSGSMGRLLPLHLAVIFTVPYNTLKHLLETYPTAVSIKCEIDGIKTFVPNNCTPLELHDQLSTDFPKWEIQRANYEPMEEMTQTMLDKIYGAKNGIRRSDLIFAFCPNALPYRKEAHRIRRMERIIQQEMTDQNNYDDFVLTRPAESFWVWLCEFQNANDKLDHYAESVLRIINTLSYNAIRFLASVLNGEGYPVIDSANLPCVDVIIGRLDTISQTGIPVRMQTLSAGLNMSPRSPLLRQFDDDTFVGLRLFGRGFVGPLCRTIFNITETTYPSSFVLLPYKLVKDAKGRLGLESSQAAKVAMKFAQFLSDMTTPKVIIDVLDNKVFQTLGKNLIDRMNWVDHETLRKHFDEFLKLYEDSPAYFYFIDDYTGIPIVDESNGIYPLIISGAAEIVEKVFPMMLLGMILMRGEKTISILLDVLLDNSINLVPPHWIEGAKDLIGYAFSSHGYSIKPSRNLIQRRHELISLVQNRLTENKAINNGCHTNEWLLEISLIKMILETHDPKHFFCGLSKQQSSTRVLWTLKTNCMDDSLDQIDFKSTKILKTKFCIEGEDAPIVRGYEERFEDTDAYDGISKSNDTNIAGRESNGDEHADVTFVGDMPVLVTNANRIENFETGRSDVSSDNFGRIYSQSERKKITSLYKSGSVAKLREQQEEQDAKIDLLQQKVTRTDNEGDSLKQREGKVTGMINKIVNQKNDLERPSRDGLEKVKALLMRICELEDRVLCREIEVGQLKNEILVFQVEASGRTDPHGLNAILSSSDHVVARSFDDTNDRREDEISDPLVEGTQVRNERIQLAESVDFLNIDRVERISDGDESTAESSTLYDSSIDGYPAEYSSAGLSSVIGK